MPAPSPTDSLDTVRRPALHAATVRQSGATLRGQIGEPPSLRGILPLMAIIFAVSIVALSGVAIAVGVAQHVISSQTSMVVGRSALELERRSLGRTLKDYAWWDEAVTALAIKPDFNWADANIGPSLAKDFGIDNVFVVDGDGRTVLNFSGGKKGSADAMVVLQGGLRTLVEQARSAPLSEPRSALGYLILDGKPQLVGASALTPQEGSPAWPANLPRSVLIFVQALDQDFLGTLEKDFGLARLHVLQPGEAALGASLPLLSPDGAAIATLTWAPNPTGFGLFLWIAAGTAVLVLGMVGLFSVVLRRAHGVGEALFQQSRIIEQIHDAIVGTDTAGVINRWNAGAQRILGWHRSEVLGRPAAEVGLADVFGLLNAARSESRASPRHLDFEASIRKKSGQTFQARVSLSELTSEGGEFIGVISYALDITDQKKLEARLEEMATVDPLTKANTRRFLLDHGPPELLRARRYRRPLSCLFLDLDHFKRVNDRLGHKAGDQVLASFGKLCREVLRGPDILCRYGGEEFVALLPETGIDEAAAVAHRVNDRVRGAELSDDPAAGHITVSIGVAALQESDKDLQALIDRADRAMYRAKELGRDRVEIFR